MKLGLIIFNFFTNIHLSDKLCKIFIIGTALYFIGHFVYYLFTK